MNLDVTMLLVRVLTTILVGFPATALSEGGFRNPLPATLPEPRNLAEAVGTYLAAADQLVVFKESACGYTLRRSVPSYEDLAERTIIPAFPSEARREVRAELLKLKKDISQQSHSVYSNVYKYYIEVERQDHATTCGMMHSAFISLFKMSAEAFERIRTR